MRITEEALSHLDGKHSRTVGSIDALKYLLLERRELLHQKKMQLAGGNKRMECPKCELMREAARSSIH